MMTAMTMLRCMIADVCEVVCEMCPDRDCRIFGGCWLLMLKTEMVVEDLDELRTFAEGLANVVILSLNR